MLEDHPNWPVTRTQGESVMRFETTTFSTLSPRFSLMAAQRPSNLATSLEEVGECWGGKEARRGWVKRTRSKGRSTRERKEQNAKSNG